MITETKFLVMYFEIDKMGIVHHSNYPKWFEMGRKDFLRKAGVSQSNMNNHGFYLPLSKLECNFKSPARYGDKITVITSLTLVSCAKIRFDYKILNNRNSKLIAFGYTVHAWTDKDIKPLNIETAAPQIFSSLKALMEIEEAN